MVFRECPEAEACIRHLFLTDPSEDREALKRKKGHRAQGTCEWILGTAEITEWLGSGQPACADDQSHMSQFLWLHGNPGTGKSTVSIFLTETLAKIFSETDGKSLAYFFCDAGFDEQRTATSILRGLLLQFLQQHPRLVRYVLPEYNERGAKLFSSFDALWKVFSEAVADAETGTKYCVIDALDECVQESRLLLLTKFEAMFRDKNIPFNIRIFVTSRKYPDIEESLEHFPNKDLASYSQIAEDIDRCIQEKVDYLSKRKRYTPKLKLDVSTILKQKAEHTFLWVGLACRELEDVPSKDALRVLKDMPQKLPLLYKSLLDKAHQHNRSNGDVVRRILGVVAISVRPMSISELSRACQLYEDEPDEDTRIQFTRDEIAIFHLLIVVQEEKILLLHQSVRDFLVSPVYGHCVDIQLAHAELSYRCIGTLIKRFSCSHEQRTCGLSRYAGLFWTKHAHQAQEKFQIRETEAEFFKINSACREEWLNWLRPHDLERPEYWRLNLRYRDNQSDNRSSLPEKFSILHIAARWSIPAIIENVCSLHIHESGTVKSGQRFDINTVDKADLTALDWAALSLNADIFSLLLQLGAAVSSRTIALAAQREDLMALLLEQQGDEMIITEEAALMVVGSGETDLDAVKLLFDRCRNENLVTDRVVTAAAGNYLTGAGIMDRLLDSYGSDIKITEEVMEAAAGNWIHGSQIINLLLDRRGSEMKITDKVMEAAATNHCEGFNILSALLKRRENKINITEKTIQAATESDMLDNDIFILLLKEKCITIPITEPVITAILENCNQHVIGLFLNRYCDMITVTVDVIQALVRNLSDKAGRNLTAEDGRNLSDENGKELIAMLFNRHKIIITEELIACVVEHFDEQVVEHLFHRYSQQITITENIVEGAARNLKSREKILAVLYSKWRDAVATAKVARLARDDARQIDDTVVISPFLSWERMTDCHYGPKEEFLELSGGLCNGILGLQFSPDGKQLAAFGCWEGDAVIIWSVPAFTVIQSLSGHASNISNLEWSPDSSLVVTCSDLGSVRLWDAHVSQVS